MTSENQKRSNGLVIALLIALLVALIGLVVLVATVFLRGSDEGADAATYTPIAVATSPGGLVDPAPTGIPVATAIIPTPAPDVPQGTVIAPAGVNVRTGPGTVYPIIFRAPFGSEGVITGRSADGAWWVVLIPDAPNSQGWVASDFIAAENAENVPVVPPPPVPATPTPIPPVIESFTLIPNPISMGDCTNIQWAVGGGATTMRIIKNGFNTLVEGSELTGLLTDCPNSAGAKSYQLEARNDAGETVMQEIILTVQEVNPLANTNWTLTSMNVNQVPLPGTTLTAFFGAEFTLSGEGGCNAYTGSYSINGNAIVISVSAGGNASCGEAIDQQEQLYASLFRSVTSFEISGNQLILRSGNQEVLRYNRS